MKSNKSNIGDEKSTQLISALFGAVNETIPKNDVVSVHELVYKTIIDLPNSEYKKKALDKLYKKINLLHKK